MPPTKVIIIVHHHRTKEAKIREVLVKQQLKITEVDPTKNPSDITGRRSSQGSSLLRMGKLMRPKKIGQS